MYYLKIDELQLIPSGTFSSWGYFEIIRVDPLPWAPTNRNKAGYEAPCTAGLPAATFAVLQARHLRGNKAPRYD